MRVHSTKEVVRSSFVATAIFALLASAFAAPEASLTPAQSKRAEAAKLAFDRGDYREAEQAYERLLIEAPNNLYALSNLGVVQFYLGKLEAAAKSLQKAISVAPNDAFSHCTLGIVYYSQGRYDDAVKALTKALTMDAKSATAHNYLGIVAAQKGWHEAAQKELETAERLQPSIEVRPNVGDFLTPLEKSRIRLPSQQ
jgi:tetratricopeptide (TPR) repeat protein